jgi:hypothetical protein
MSQLHHEHCRSAWRQDPHHFAVKDADQPGRVVGDAEQMLIAVEIAGKDGRLARWGRTANLIRPHVHLPGWPGLEAGQPSQRTASPVPQGREATEGMRLADAAVNPPFHGVSEI